MTKISMKLKLGGFWICTLWKFGNIKNNLPTSEMWFQIIPFLPIVITTEEKK